MADLHGVKTPAVFTEQARHRVAIVVPVTDRPGLSHDEEQSLRHLEHHLGRYDKYFVAPEGSAWGRCGFGTVTFARKFFGSAAAHNRLVMSPSFYKAFRSYEFILIYHLDSLVFSDQLLEWCDAGLDYIGAPWLPCPDTPWVREARVGNGGFTLMRVESALRVLYARYRREPSRMVIDAIARNEASLSPLFASLERLPASVSESQFVGRLLTSWRVNRNPGSHGLNNDLFFSYMAPRYVSRYVVASVEQGLRFAFEASPRTCFEITGGRLPFGCHAWARFDRAFWEPYLLPLAAVASTAHADGPRLRAI
jgi:hypothetical protein